MKLARDGYDVLIKVSLVVLVMIVAGVYLGSWPGNILMFSAAVLMALTLNFFRDPDRKIPSGDDLILSPADGKVVMMKELDEVPWLESKATQISIFLSALDVHVNRIPLGGAIRYVKYHEGEYLLAWHEKASEKNEQSEFGLEHPSGYKMIFKQITGYVARRIVYHLEEGDTVKAGDRFGMMKFGSRMDLFLPSGTDIYVKEGDVVRAGESIIGRVKGK